MTSKTLLLFSLLLWLGNTARAQISQDHPELCGSVKSAQLPDGISIVTAAGQGTSMLSIKSLNSTIRLPGVEEIKGNDTKLEDVSFQTGRDGHLDISVKLTSPNTACGGRNVLLGVADFAPAETEFHSIRHRTPSELKP